MSAAFGRSCGRVCGVAAADVDALDEIVYNEIVSGLSQKEAAMLKLISAVALTMTWVVMLGALMAPGLGSIEDGLSSGKRIALAQYAAEHDADGQ